MWLLKINNSNTRRKRKLCSKSKKNTEERHWDYSGVSVLNFEQVDARGLIQEKNHRKSVHNLVDNAKGNTCKISNILCTLP